MGKNFKKRFVPKQGAPKSGSSFKAPTVGLESAVFSIGSTRNAAAFEETKSKLSRYVGTQSWRGSALAALAIEKLAVPL